ncbi:hypothetical protein BG004_008367 [Podila humilis]|nr:hypothetical protein BG004_008367 [Podila humilis]
MTGDRPPVYSTSANKPQPRLAIWPAASSVMSTTFEYFRAPMCAISLVSEDRIRLVNTPPELTQLIRQAIQYVWGPIQKESDQYDFGNTIRCSIDSSLGNGGPANTSCTDCAHKVYGASFYSFDFKLKGCPWMPHGDGKIKACRLVLAILAIMANHDWDVQQATKVLRLTNDHSTFMFISRIRRDGCEPVAYTNSPLSTQAQIEVQGGLFLDTRQDPCVQYRVQLFAISFHKSSMIRVIDSPIAVHSIVRQAIVMHWPTGLKSETDTLGVKEFTLMQVGSTNALRSDSVCAVQWTMVLVALLSLLQELSGFMIYASAAITIDRELETWILRKMNGSWP